MKFRFVHKNTLAIVAVGIACALVLPVFSQNRYTPLTQTFRFTQDRTVMQAFQLLERTSGRTSLDIILDRATRVMFKDLRQINKKLKHFHAISWTSGVKSSQYLIFINEKHRSAPPEALAALIAHEAMHNDPHNSLNEEVAGWRREVEVWMEMKRLNPSLNQIPAGQDDLVDRLNELERVYKAGNFDAFVRSQPGYTGLAETSPGFETGVSHHHHPHLAPVQMAQQQPQYWAGR